MKILKQKKKKNNTITSEEAIFRFPGTPTVGKKNFSMKMTSEKSH